MKDSPVLWFLYRTVPGRLLLKLLVQPKISRLAGRILSSKISRYLVPYYIRKHKIDLYDIEVPQGGFSSFNEFFTRKRDMKCLDITSGHLISPCDGFFTPVRIREGITFRIKQSSYSLQDLLQEETLSGKFEDGTVLIFRLTPADYHRYCYPADGQIILSKEIRGKLHCVRPVAVRTVPVYAHNSRAYQVIETEQFGTMVQMEVGALLVGKIVNYERSLENPVIRAGDEKGYFEFGGSTILLFFQKDRICIHKTLQSKIKNHAETPVRMGECVALRRRERRTGNEQ